MTTSGWLYRSSSDRVLCGVSGGLAEYFDVDPALVRVGWTIFTCVTVGAAALGYLFLSMVLPDDERVPTDGLNTIRIPPRRTGPEASAEVSDGELTPAS